MSETSRNWDFSRLAYMDVIIMQIAIAEMLTFPNIPISVTINEYVELAKVYSTPRSGSYINGMLDAIARYLIQTGAMFKPMDMSRNNIRKQSDKEEKKPAKARFIHAKKDDEPKVSPTEDAKTEDTEGTKAEDSEDTKN
jgi:N utilization substance protein B